LTFTFDWLYDMEDGEWMAELPDSNDYYLIAFYGRSKYALSFVKRIAKLDTLEEAKGFAALDLAGSRPTALEKFRDDIGAWLVETMDEVCPICEHAPTDHDPECWVQLTLNAWDELHGL
jgi:hypothetical protein